MLSHNDTKHTVVVAIFTLTILLILLFIVINATSYAQEPQCTTIYFPDTHCNEDESKVSDPRGGFKCVKKIISMEWPAKQCIKDFKPSDNTKIIVPLDSEGNPVYSLARLENFDFKMVCPVVKQRSE